MDIDAIIKQLWQKDDFLAGEQVHMLVDGARHAKAAQHVQLGGLDYTCLFSEPLTPSLRAAAPFLVHLTAQSSQIRELLGRCADFGGILTTSPADVSMRQLQLHFKKKLWVKDMAGRRMYFRFYDPRVLNAYLPTCTLQEQRSLFGPVRQIHYFEQDRLLSFDRPDRCAASMILATQGAPVIRDQQLDALRRDFFIRNAYREICNKYSRLNPYAREETIARVSAGIDLAARSGLQKFSDHLRLAELTVLFGIGFERAQRWAQPLPVDGDATTWLAQLYRDGVLEHELDLA